MFARIKKSGAHQYLQVVENRREGPKTHQRVVATIGRLDQLQAKNDIEHLIRSLSRFSEQVLLVLSGQRSVDASAQTIGPALIFERLWDQLGLRTIIHQLVRDRKFGFEVERAIFLTVLHRLFPSGSDRFCDHWRRDYRIPGTERLALHHLYRAMAFLGEAVNDQRDRTPFTPRCTKDLVEEALFEQNRNLFSGLDLVFLDTTSLYFEGQGGQGLGRRGHSKDHRPDLNQMVVGLVLDDRGRPVCSEMWPGNTADVKTVIPVTERIRHRFPISRFCLVADRGMISQETRNYLERNDIPYILGARMRQVTEIREEVLSRAGRYREVTPEGLSAQDPAPLKVKEVRVADHRYIVCLNTKQARKEAHDRQVIVESLQEATPAEPQGLDRQ
jgi:Transposase DDE domain